MVTIRLICDTSRSQASTRRRRSTSRSTSLRVGLCILRRQRIALRLDPLEILTPTLDVLLLPSLLVLLLQPRQQCAQAVASEDGAFCIVGDNGPSRQVI